ncbi:MAG: DUF4388 domain-containing protein [Myxococcales bacterium]
MHKKDASRDGPPQSKALLFSDIDGVHGYCVGDTAGNTVDDHLTSDDSSTAIAVGVVVNHHFGEIGDCLGLGDFTMITARGETGSWLRAFMEGHSIAVRLDANVSPTKLEAAVRHGVWLPKADWEVSDAEIEYVPPNEVPAQGTAKVALAPRVASTAATLSKPVEPRLAPPVSPAATLAKPLAASSSSSRTLSRPPGASSSSATALSKPPRSPSAAPSPVATTLSNPLGSPPTTAPLAATGSTASTTLRAKVNSPLADAVRTSGHAQFDLSAQRAVVTEALQPKPPEVTTQLSGTHPAAMVTRPAPIPTPVVTGPAQTPKPPAPQSHAGGSDSSIPVAAVQVKTKGLQLAVANARGLRRAFARGDLKEARAIAEHLRHASPTPGDPCGSGTSAEVIEPLLTGIASTLFGDSKSALEHLLALTKRSEIGPSLTWIALVWCARACIASADGLEQALTWAEAAGRLSKQLDVEARIVSARLIAEVCLYRSNLEHAERFVEQARRISESVADRDESGELSLLQAKILFASGKRPQAVASAERAHVFRQQWVAPVIFLSRCAFGDGDIERVHGLIAPFHDRDDAPTEIVQVERLLASVRNADLPAATAAEFLALDEAPLSSSCIEQLEVLAGAFPRLELIRDRLGWKLLKAGRYGRAAEVFEPLSQRQDLPEAVRSSVLLALGCLAANRARNVSAGARVRASVDAAPGHLRLTKPPRGSSSRMRVAPIVDLVRIEPPPSFAENSQLGTGPSSVPQSRSASPIFTGSLLQFCLPDVLEFLRAGRRTGTLLCSSVRGIGAVHLRTGLIGGAAAPSTASLRDVLIAAGKLTAEIAAKAVAYQQQAQAHLPMGSILISQGWTSEEDIAASLRTQTYAAVAEVLQWGDGLFAFAPEYGEGETETQVEIALDPQAMLIDIYREIEERAGSLR